jgi:hypothetical protein
MSNLVLLPRKLVEEMDSPTLRAYRTSIQSDIHVLASIPLGNLDATQRKECEQALNDGHATVKTIDAEIARRAIAHMNTLTQRIAAPLAQESQEGENPHE